MHVRPGPPYTRAARPGPITGVRYGTTQKSTHKARRCHLLSARTPASRCAPGGHARRRDEPGPPIPPPAAGKREGDAAVSFMPPWAVIVLFVATVLLICALGLLAASHGLT